MPRVSGFESCNVGGYPQRRSCFLASSFPPAGGTRDKTRRLTHAQALMQSQTSAKKASSPRNLGVWSELS